MDYMHDNINIPYPDLYNRIAPKVDETMKKHMPNMHVLPNQQLTEEMVNEVYGRMVEECPEIAEDPMENRRRGMSEDPSMQQRPFYGRRRLLRDTISIILLGRLFGGIGAPRYGYPRYGYPRRGFTPGFGYPGYGYPWYRY